MSIHEIPQRQDTEQRPSPKVRAVAARVRVNADRRVGKVTPTWIVDLSKSAEAK